MHEDLKIKLEPLKLKSKETVNVDLEVNLDLEVSLAQLIQELVQLDLQTDLLWF